MKYPERSAILSLPVQKNNHLIPQKTRSLISLRYKKITKAVNEEFWEIRSDSAHSLYVGSYGRGTAIDTSDLDVLVELPDSEYKHFTSLSGNGASRLLQAVKNAIIDTYPRTDIKADGQVVVVRFSDPMKFEILPAFRRTNCWGEWDGTYIYPDAHMGGNWLTTDPKAEQKAMKNKNSPEESNGLLFDTCKHIRYIRDKYYSSYHLSGILIDTFIYSFIADWHWRRNYENDNHVFVRTPEKWENYLFHTYKSYYSAPPLCAPGSCTLVDTKQDWAILGKALQKMAE